MKIQVLRKGSFYKQKFYTYTTKNTPLSLKKQFAIITSREFRNKLQCKNINVTRNILYNISISTLHRN